MNSPCGAVFLMEVVMKLIDILSELDNQTTYESELIEFKESFNLANFSKYSKTMVGFANNKGGCIIFGVSDDRELKGLSKESFTRFNSIDNALLTQNIRKFFSHNITWDKELIIYKDKNYAMLVVKEEVSKPIICIANDSNILRESVVYYRYNSETTTIKPLDLVRLIENEKDKINQLWIEKIDTIKAVGVENTSILDHNSAKLYGNYGTVYFDEDLINDISFVKEGSFVNTGGDPALIVSGYIQTLVGGKKIKDIVIETKSINYDLMIVNFLKQEVINNPIEYILQVPYMTSSNYPIFYYINKTKMSIEKIIEKLNEVPNQSQNKIRLLERLSTDIVNSKFRSIKVTDSFASKKKQEYRKMLLNDESFTMNNLSEKNNLRYLLQSIQGFSKREILSKKERLLSLMFDIYKQHFNSEQFKDQKFEVRNTICWIDEALFKNDVK